MTPTKGEVIARIGAAVAAVSTVHVDVVNDSGPTGLAIDLDYGGGAVDVRVPPADARAAEIEIRRVEAQLYFDLGDADGWQRVASDDPRLARNSDGILLQILAFDLLADLRSTFVDGSDFTALGQGELEGATVDLYTVTLDVAALVRPSLFVQAAIPGTVEVGLAVGSDGRPVRIDYGTAPDKVSSLRFSDWGVPVAIPVPPLG